MVETLDSGTRRARKAYRCGLCESQIRPGDQYAYQVNIYDGRIYTWHGCLACDRDGIGNLVSAWTGGWADEGVNWEAFEWAAEAVTWHRYGKPLHPAERLAARNFCARAAGEE